MIPYTIRLLERGGRRRSPSPRHRRHHDDSRSSKQQRDSRYVHPPTHHHTHPHLHPPTNTNRHYSRSPRRYSRSPPRRRADPNPPPIGAILRARVMNVRPFGVFVEMEGYARHGLVHSSQVVGVVYVFWYPSHTTTMSTSSPLRLQMTATFPGMMMMTCVSRHWNTLHPQDHHVGSKCSMSQATRCHVACVLWIKSMVGIGGLWMRDQHGGSGGGEHPAV